MRNVFISIFLLLCAEMTLGQGRFGLKAGSNLYYLKATNDKTRDYRNSKPGYSFGAFYELPASGHFSVQPELSYSYQRSEETYYGSKLNTGYVLLPILLKYRLGSTVDFYAGPQFGFLTTASSKLNNVTTDMKEDFSRTDFGITAGIGTSPAKGGLNFDIRVYHGVIDVIKSEFDGGLRTRNVLISATVGYIFGKRK